MKSLAEKPGGELAEPALWSLGLGLLALGILAFTPAAWPILVPLALAYLLVGFGAWQEIRAAVFAGMVLFGLAALARGIGLLCGFSWSKLGSMLLFGWLAWRFFAALRQRAGKGEDPAEGAGEEEEVGGEDRPMVSIALFQRVPRYLDSRALAAIVGEAWGGDYGDGEEEGADGFVVGSSPAFPVKSPHGLFIVHNHDAPYFTDPEEVAEEVGELRLRKALLDHRAWIAVDLLAPSDESLPREHFYPAIIRLIHDLADEDTLAVYRPETGQVNLWNHEVLETLLMPSGEERFAGVVDEVPVIRVGRDDPAMAEAVAEARRRWDEFEEAFRGRSEGDRFSVKAALGAGERTEHIWVVVDGIAGGVVFGTLGNEPVDLPGYRLGSPVEVPVDEVEDWCVAPKEGEPLGLFTLAAVEAAERRFRQRSGDG
jgi:uncharacterized protein YegJ (DUF2314 family)